MYHPTVDCIWRGLSPSIEAYLASRGWVPEDELPHRAGGYAIRQVSCRLFRRLSAAARRTEQR